jgi:hypothetical protein
VSSGVSIIKGELNCKPTAVESGLLVGFVTTRFPIILLQGENYFAIAC